MESKRAFESENEQLQTFRSFCNIWKQNTDIFQRASIYREIKIKQTKKKNFNTNKSRLPFLIDKR